MIIMVSKFLTSAVRSNFDFCFKIYISDVNTILLLFHGHFPVMSFSTFFNFLRVIQCNYFNYTEENIVEKHTLSKGVSFSKNT